MNASLNQILARAKGDRAVDLLAETTYAMRADASFVEREGDVAGAVFLGQEEPSPLDVDALNRVLGRIDDAEALDREAQQHGARGGLDAEIARLPSPVREAAFDALADHHRWTFSGFGIQRLDLFADRDSHAVLMRIEPGRGVAEHDHEDEELTLVLTGAYNDGAAGYRPGDVSIAEPGFIHTPRAEPGDVCYVLLAYKGGPKFKGLFGLAQRLFGFPTPLTGR
jgi:putative transcriptional regulator